MRQKRLIGRSKMKIFVLALVVNITLGTLSAKYAIEFWMTHLNGSTFELRWGAAIVLGLIFGEVFIPIALVTLIVSIWSLR